MLQICGKPYENACYAGYDKTGWTSWAQLSLVVTGGGGHRKCSIFVQAKYENICIELIVFDQVFTSETVKQFQYEKCVYLKDH